MTQNETGFDAARRVSLIGCGPGDPELITVKAVRRVAAADVLVVDRLVGPAVLELAKPTAVIIPVGKEAGGPSTSQDEINRILIREALKGAAVVRLKGGDGFIFGRAAEEIAALRTAGIEVEIVPGITAAHACAARIALPLTLRETVRQFSVVTGETADGVLDLDWAALSRGGQAFAIYMGVRSVRRLSAKLMEAGAAADMPMVVVENGTRASEVAVSATLAQLPEAIAAYGIKGPAIIFGGLCWQDANLTRPANVRVYHPGEIHAREPAHRPHAPEAL